MNVGELDLSAPWWHTVIMSPTHQLDHFVSYYNALMGRALLKQKPLHSVDRSGKYSPNIDVEDSPKNLIGFLENYVDARVIDRRYTKNLTPQEIMMAWDQGYLVINFGKTSIDVAFATEDTAELQIINKYLDDLLAPPVPKGSVYMMSVGKLGPEFKNIGVGGIPLERHNYEDAILAAYDRVVVDVSATSPRGRLSIFDGPPGCGKTYLIRGLLDQIQHVVFILIPSHCVASLGEPSSLSAIMKLRVDTGKPLVFIIEDADECLATRDGANISAISTILNLGDGIIGSVLDIRIVATTNAKYTEFDPAIRRPGRLTVMQTVGPFTLGKGREVYRRLCPDANPQDIDGKLTLAQVYQMAYDKGWRAPKLADKTVGFETSPRESLMEMLDDDGYDD